MYLLCISRLSEGFGDLRNSKIVERMLEIIKILSVFCHRQDLELDTSRVRETCLVFAPPASNMSCGIYPITKYQRKIQQKKEL